MTEAPALRHKRTSIVPACPVIYELTINVWATARKTYAASSRDW
ncbi:hypothetical protein J2W51_004405 [Tardiphaga robiniae]|nr:hypothetical protein [Tardiphaga robiniae]